MEMHPAKDSGPPTSVTEEKRVEQNLDVEAAPMSAAPKPSETHNVWRGALQYGLMQGLLIAAVQTAVHYAAKHARDREIYHYLIIFWTPQTKQQLLSSALVFGLVVSTVQVFLVEPYLRRRN